MAQWQFNAMLASVMGAALFAVPMWYFKGAGAGLVTWALVAIVGYLQQADDRRKRLAEHQRLYGRD